MAEVVEYRVEKTLDEINQLIEFGILDESHGKEILSKRQNFEYKLRRRTENKLEYLKYIRFELNLLESIEKYKKAVIKDYYENNKNKTSSDKLEDIERKILLLQAKKLNDIIRSRSTHISSLFRKLVYKHQFDTKLWLAYIEFSKRRKWNNRVSSLYWRLLRVASNDESIWLQAAEHEIETNKAYDVARGLYLKALRHHPKSANVWADYFKMETKFMDIVAQRARIIFKVTSAMGPASVEENNKNDGQPKTTENDDIWADSMTDMDKNDEIFHEDDDTKIEKSNLETESNDRIPEAKAIDDKDEIIGGKLPMIVYDNASKSLTTASEFSKFIVKILDHIYNVSEETKGLTQVREHILSDLEAHQNSSQKELRLAEDLLMACRSRETFVGYMKQMESARANPSLKRPKLETQQLSKIDTLYESYESKGIEETRILFEKLEKSVKNQSLSLYVGMIQVELWHLKKCPNDVDQMGKVRKIYDKALMKFGKTKPKLWYEYIKFENDHAKNLEDFERINEIYLRAQATLEASKVDRVVEKYTLIRANSSSADLDYSDYSDLDG